MTRGLHLRPYAPADWERLCAIHDSARLQELKAAGLAEAFLTLEQTAQNEGLFDGALVVAEQDGHAVGFVAYTEDSLDWLYVEPACQGKGIGGQLLRHAVDACRGVLRTEVLVGNAPALALYLRQGFQVIRRVDGRLTGNEAFAASGDVLERDCKADRAL